jgi:atypical dual specificity phosphatase
MTNPVCHTQIPKDKPLEEKEVFSVVNHINDLAKKCFTSPLFWTTALSLLGIGLGIFGGISIFHSQHILLNSIFLGASTALLISSIVLGRLFKKEASHEFQIFWNSNFWPKGSYYNQINDDLVLGALPLKNKGHIEELKNLAKKENKELGVLTIVEPWELEEHLLSSPVTLKDWDKQGVEQETISVEDHKPLNFEELNKAVKFITDQIKKGKIVYVHCKAGKGRSAMAVAAYLIKTEKFKNKDVAEVINFIKGKRPVITLDKNETKKQILQKFKKT